MPVLHAQHGSDPGQSPQELRRILRLEVPVIVKLAERKLLLSEVMRLGVGAIIEFVKSSNEPLELLINNKTIGVGETVKVGENFGLRITRIGDLKQVVESLGADLSAPQSLAKPPSLLLAVCPKGRFRRPGRSVSCTLGSNASVTPGSPFQAPPNDIASSTPPGHGLPRPSPLILPIPAHAAAPAPSPPPSSPPAPPTARRTPAPAPS